MHTAPIVASLLAATLLTTAMPALARKAVPPPPPPPPPPVYVVQPAYPTLAYGVQPTYAAAPTATELLESGRRLHRVGFGLTVGGAIAFPLGIVLTVVGVAYGGAGGTFALASGVILTITGIPALGAGVPLWIIGKRRIARARELGAVGLVPNLQLDRGGVFSGSLSLKLAW